MSIPDWRASTAFRTAALAAGFFALAGLLILAGLYVALGRELKAPVEAEIAGRSAALAALWRDGGMDRAAVVDADFTRTSTHGDFYLVLAADGRRLAGNGVALAPFAGWREWADDGAASTAAGDPSDRSPVLALGVPVGDVTLIVGRAVPALGEAREVVLRLFGAGLAATLALALLGGWLLGRSSIRRIDGVAASTRRISGGDLAARLPLSGAGDDIDRLSADINAMLDRMVELMAAMKRVTSDIAHDLKAPLARLRQKLEPMVESGQANAEQLRAALADVDGVIATFNALLRIAEIEAGARRAKFAAVDLGALAQDVAEIHRPVADDRGKTLTVKLVPRALVQGDASLLRQLASNLLDNAVKHAPDGGCIRLAVQHGGAGRILLEVADDGPGIPAAERDDVLRPFYRLERSRSTPGNGLGLTTVKAIADLHGAGLTLADNQPGLRVTVTFDGLPQDGPPARIAS